MFTFRALAGGSSGNAYLLRTDKVNLLFEAGLPTATLCSYLAREAVASRDRPSLRWTGMARPRQLSFLSGPEGTRA